MRTPIANTGHARPLPGSTLKIARLKTGTMGMLLTLLCSLFAQTAPAQEPTPTAMQTAALLSAEGLWEYTDLITKDGQSLPLTGIFLIREGRFLQQSIFNGEPFESQGSMAHAGPYWAGGAGLRLRSNQTLSLDPGSATPLESAGAMEHDLKVTRSDDTLTLVFGGGTSTIQTFRLLSEAKNTRLFAFANGELALSDGYFVLVIGDDSEVVSGYGRYVQNGTDMSLEAIRWAQSDGNTVRNLRDTTIAASFDGRTLNLPGDLSFEVLP